MAEVPLQLGGERPLPYVYRLTHRETGRFYIGVRCGNVRLGKRADDDLGIRYKSSCPSVRANFCEYEALVVAECFSRDAALLLERELIEAEIGNPLLINRAIWKVGYCGPFVGTTKGTKLSDEHKKKIGAAHRGMKRSSETCMNIAKALTGRKIYWSDERRRKFHETTGGRDLGPEWRKKLSEGQRKRFERDEDRQSNRRASRLGFIQRVKLGKVKQLEVTSNEGRVRVFYSSVGAFCYGGEYSAAAVHSAAARHPGVECKQGKLKGLAFRLVDPDPLPDFLLRPKPKPWEAGSLEENRKVFN